MKEKSYLLQVQSMIDFEIEDFQKDFRTKDDCEALRGKEMVTIVRKG